MQIPSSLRHEVRGARQVTLSAATVAEALALLERSHPPLYKSVCDETGAVRRHVHLFINSSLVHRLDAKLADGDTLSIMPAVSGGS